MLLVRGKFEKDDESARLVATELLPIAALKERTTREVVIHLTVPPPAATRSRRSPSCCRATAATAGCFLELDVTQNRRSRLRVRSDVASGAGLRPSEQLVSRSGDSSAGRAGSVRELTLIQHRHACPNSSNSKNRSASC